MEPQQSTSATCSIHCIIDKLSKKWSMLILRTIMKHKRLRFSEIREALPEINSRILSARLSEFEKEKLVDRKIENTKPIIIYYEITEKGMDLRKVFKGFVDWSKKWGNIKN